MFYRFHVHTIFGCKFLRSSTNKNWPVNASFVCLAESRFPQNIFNGTQGKYFRASKDLGAKEKRLER